MSKNESPDFTQWFRCLDGDFHNLVITADRLLERYPKQRRKPESSVAGRILFPLAAYLNALSVFPECKQQENFRIICAAVQERLVLLSQRRVPPCFLLHKLRLQCSKLLRFLREALPEHSHWDSPSVLVGSLRRPDQLGICLHHKFYHVPVCRIPEGHLPIEYVAIYQSRSFFSRDCGIRYFGRVKSCITVPRYEITEIPKVSDELYYRLEVDDWDTLEHPVAVREIPITHLFTNLCLLTHAHDTPELTLASPMDYHRYQLLRSAVEFGNGAVVQWPEGKLRIKNGTIRLRKHRRRIAVFSIDEYRRTPAAVFQKLLKQ